MSSLGHMADAVSVSFPIKLFPQEFIPGTLSANGSTGGLGFSVGRELVCAMDGTAVLVELDQDGYVVCHWPLSYGVFEAESVDLVLDMVAVPVEVYEVDQKVELSLLRDVETEYDVLLVVEMLAEIFVGCTIELEYVGMLRLVVRELDEDEVALEATLRVVDGVERIPLLEEASAVVVGDELVLNSVIVIGSGSSTVTVGELTSITE